MDVYFFLISLCAFFTLLALFRRHSMWGILSAISWMLFFWYTRSNPIAGFALGDWGDTILISICFGAAVYILVQTVIWYRGERQTTIEKADKAIGKAVRRISRNIGARETSDEYYDRLSRLTGRRR